MAKDAKKKQQKRTTSTTTKKKQIWKLQISKNKKN